MKQGSIYWGCPKCGKKVVQTKHSWLYIDDLLHDLKIHFHCKFKHGLGFYKTKGIVKRLFLLIPLGLFNLLTFILWLITFPFWALHELLG